MKTISLLFMISLIIAAGCKKTTTGNYGENGLMATDTVGLYGEWQWKGSWSGLYADSAAADSVITLTLRPDHSYAIGLNGNLTNHGTYSVSVNSYGDSLIHFNNLPQPNSSTQSGTTTIQFVTYQVGRLFFFENDEISFDNNSLTLLSYPISPEAYTADFFKQ